MDFNALFTKILNILTHEISFSLHMEWNDLKKKENAILRGRRALCNWLCTDSVS